MAIKKDESTEIFITEIHRETIEFCILGKTPMLMNSMSAKAQRELLMPKGKKNAAEKASSLKHDPVQEYRNSVYRTLDPEARTLLGVPAAAFKGAMETAALDMPGAKKAQIGRLVTIEGEMLELFGAPKLRMDVVRSADMNKTPDVRTRAIIQEWACRIAVSFSIPILRRQSVVNLLSAAGVQSGIGDGRQEKGWGNFGSFIICEPDDADFKRIMKTQGRAAQEVGLEKAEPYDDKTAELLSWFEQESKRRGFKVVA